MINLKLIVDKFRGTKLQNKRMFPFEQRKYEKPSLACILTGIPRGSELCLESLKFVTAGYEAKFFAVFREEFDTSEVRNYLERVLPGIVLIIIPSKVTEEAVSRFEGKLELASTVVKMWHEVFYAGQIIDFANFDMVMRTRFDLFFSPMQLPYPAKSDANIFIPTNLSWSGSNDMIALGGPVAFEKYTQIYQILSQLAIQGIKVPEMIVSCALTHLKLHEKVLDIHFGLYRKELMSSFNIRELGVLAFKSPGSTTYKIGEEADTLVARENWIKDVQNLIRDDALFPTYQITSDFNFYAVEIDHRDGTPFRFMGLHAHLNRAVSVVQTIEFLICHYPAGWDMNLLKISIDGHLFGLQKKGVDKFGRILVRGRLEYPYKGKQPWSKVGLSCLGAVIPAELDSKSSDRRSLTIAISEPQFK